MADFLVYNSTPEISQGVNIALAYSKGDIVGWDYNLAADAFKFVGGPNIYSGLPAGLVSSAEGRKAFLFQVVRKVLGQDTKNYPQQIGDCVSFGAKNAIEYLMCCEKLLKGDREKFRYVFPPYLYGTGRVYIGRGQIGYEDGSLGTWMAEAVIKYGTIPADEEGVPAYAGNVAKAWGAPNGATYLNKWKPIGEQHPVRSAAKINNWSELVAAIVNGYPCTVASNQGFTMSPDSRGFHRPSGNWAHQMCIIGVDDEHPEPYAIILNSWGDVHGRLKSFYDSNESLPVGVLRAPKSAIQSMIAAGETFAYSNLDGFPEQSIDEALFKIVGN